MQQLINSPTYITFPVNGKIPSVKNWNQLRTKIEHIANSNYGILTGQNNNILVVDCDVLKTCDPQKYFCGVEYWNLLKQKYSFLKQLNIPTVQTQSGGLHLYFKYNPLLKSSIQQVKHNLKTVKIDILSDNKFVVGPGSNGYKFVNNSGYTEPPEMPTILVDLFKPREPFISESTVVDNNTGFSQKPVSKEDLKKLVMRVPTTFADNYQDWTKIVWAIAETAKQNDYDALDVADDFSKQSDKYGGLEDVQRVYLENKGKVTYGSLVHFARINQQLPQNLDSNTDLQKLNKTNLIADLKKIKEFYDVEDVTGIKDEENRKVLEIVFSNNDVQSAALYKDNLVTTMNDSFKGYLQKVLDVQCDLSVIHPEFKGVSKAILIDEQNLDFVFNNESVGEHRIRVKHPWNAKKSYFLKISHNKQIGNLKRNKQELSVMMNDALAPACHKILTDRYNVVVNCQVANFNNCFNNGDSNVRSEEQIIRELILSHPGILDAFKFSDSTGLFKGLYLYGPNTGIWRRENNGVLEKMLSTRIRKFVPGLSKEEVKYIETNKNIQQLRMMFVKEIDDKDFENKIDENRNVFAMTNCVYDIETREIRKATAKDFVYTNTGWDYSEEDALKYLPDVRDFFDTLFPIKEEHDVIVTFISSLIHGYRLDKKFIALTDKRNGNNGKSTLIALLRRFFGDYTKTSNKFLLKSHFDKDKDSHDGGLEPLKGKRILVCDELKKTMKLDEGLIKNLAGGEYTVEGRRLGKSDQFKFMWQAGIVMIFNEGDCPKFDCTDNAFMERMLVVPMRSKFVVGEGDESSYTFKRDPNIVSKFDLWKSALLNFFLEYCNIEGLTSINIPYTMKEWKNEILNDNNELKDWLFSIVTECKESFVSLNDLRERYREAFPHDRFKNKDVERMVNALFNNRGVYLKEQHKVREDGIQKKSRNVYVGYKFNI